MTDAQNDLSTEIEAYDQMRAQLEQHHSGKFVVIKGGNLVGAWDSFDNAAKAAVAQFGRGPYLIRQVGAPPPTIPVSVFYRPAA